jgi:hypothetical protein
MHYCIKIWRCNGQILKQNWRARLNIRLEETLLVLRIRQQRWLKELVGNMVKMKVFQNLLLSWILKWETALAKILRDRLHIKIFWCQTQEWHLLVKIKQVVDQKIGRCRIHIRFGRVIWGINHKNPINEK